MATNRKSAQTLDDASRLKAVKDYALRMYEKGWDTVIECYSDKDILAVVGHALTEQGCKYAMARHLGPQISHRREIEATAF